MDEVSYDGEKGDSCHTHSQQQIDDMLGWSEEIIFCGFVVLEKVLIRTSLFLSKSISIVVCSTMFQFNISLSVFIHFLLI